MGYFVPFDMCTVARIERGVTGIAPRFFFPETVAFFKKSENSTRTIFTGGEEEGEGGGGESRLRPSEAELPSVTLAVFVRLVRSVEGRTAG